MAAGETFWNALVGAVVTGLLAWFVPFAPLIGGFVAGYREGGESRYGIRVGALSGGFAFVVGTFISGVFTYAIVTVTPIIDTPGVPELISAFFVFATIVWALYLFAFSVLGAWLGNYVRYETDVDLPLAG